MTCPKCKCPIKETGFTTVATIITSWMPIGGELRQISQSTNADGPARCLQCDAELPATGPELLRAA